MGESRLRVLALADHLGHADGRIHGGTTYFVNAYPALRRAGVDLTVCFMARRHAAAGRLEERGVRPLFLERGKWDPRALLDVAALVRRKRIALVHLHSMKSILFGRIVARACGIPAVIHLHDPVPLQKGTRAVQRVLARWTACAIVISESLVQFAHEELAIPPGSVHVIHNGMELAPLGSTGAAVRTEVRAELGLDAEAPVIAVVGRIVADKGQAELLRAMPRVIQHHPAVRLLVVGAGVDRPHCEALARSLGIHRFVRFLGQRDDVPRLLAAVDLVAMPSMWQEAFGYAALEAHAAGKPVIGFRVGGLPAVVLHERTGLLVPRGDIESLGRSIAQVLADQPLRAAFGAAARAHAAAFSLERHVDATIACYERALSWAGGSSGSQAAGAT